METQVENNRNERIEMYKLKFNLAIRKFHIYMYK